MGKAIYDLLFLRNPTLTLPSAKPKTSSLFLSFGQTKDVTEDEAGNLLQIVFLSPQSLPTL